MLEEQPEVILVTSNSVCRFQGEAETAGARTCRREGEIGRCRKGESACIAGALFHIVLDPDRGKQHAHK